MLPLFANQRQLATSRFLPGNSSRSTSSSLAKVVQVIVVSMLVIVIIINISFFLTRSKSSHENGFMDSMYYDMSGISRSGKLIEQLGEGVLVNPSPFQMHGIVGLDAKNEPGWTPRTLNTAGKPMSQLLKQGGGFNLELSDSLPLDRNVTDPRSKACRALQFTKEELLPISVIIVFYNEPFSTLFRSVHSVLNRTPPDLLGEIILVDDGSNLDWIRAGGTGQIEAYIKLLPKTRLVRSPTRKGIVSARMIGIRASRAPIFVILDSHVEVSPGWGESISSRIAQDKRRIVMPQIGGINPETFEFSAGGIGCTLGFLWKLIEHGFDPGESSPASRRNPGPTDFVTSPTMAGGLFAANKDFFLNDLGGYDEQFLFWGTENLELSFRTWLCGGVLECAPCSHVYHIFRKGGSGYSSPVDAVDKNKMRLLTVWMDEFGDLARRVIGKPAVDFGETDTLIQWKKRKNCKPFKWFFTDVNPESFVQEVPRDVPYLGALRNIGADSCLDSLHNTNPGASVYLRPCRPSGSQEWMYFLRVKHVMPVVNDESCLAEASKTAWCNEHSQRFEYNEETKLLMFLDNGKCLSASDDRKLLFQTCDSGSENQKWDWQKYELPSKSQVVAPPPT